MSARTGRVEVLSHPERRRSWSVEQKREIVAESLGSGLTPAEVARKHGISTGQIYTWRNQLLSFRPTAATDAPQFASVELALPTSDTTAPPSRAQGLIEIVLSGGTVVRVDAHVDGRALRRVLGALAER